MMLEWDRTNEGSGIILDNKKGITDWDTLENVERRYSYIRLPELKKAEIDRKIVFNKEYFLSIHKFIFQDIYPWAGTIREVDLYKGDSAFAPARFLEGSLEEVFKNLKKDNYLRGFSRDEIAELSAYYMLELNFLHPFREGNGRTKRHFMTQLVDRAGFDLSLESIEPNQLVMADILAFDDNEAGIKANPSYLKFLLFGSIKEKDENKYKSLSNTKLSELNRFLWVYDRFDSRAYFLNKNSIQDAEQQLAKMLESEQGRERVSQILNHIIVYEKRFFDNTAEYRKDIIKKATLLKKEVEENKILAKESSMNKTIDNKEQNMTLAEKLDKFYSDYDPYGRYDGTGAFSPEYDTENEGLRQTIDALSSDKGRKQIDNLLCECIKSDERPDMVKRAKQLRIELLDPKNSKENIGIYLQQKANSNKAEQKMQNSQKKQKGIK